MRRSGGRRRRASPFWSGWNRRSQRNEAWGRARRVKEGAAPRYGWMKSLPLPVVAIVGCTLLLVPSAGAAQQYRWGVDIGMAGMTSYPRHLSRCIESAGLAPSARAHFRPHRLVRFEVGASMQFVLSSENVTDCGFFPPVLPGMTRTVAAGLHTRRTADLVTVT